MSLLWIEGFEGFGNTTGAAPSPTNVFIRKGYTTNSEANLDIETGRFGGYGLEIASQGWIGSPSFTMSGDTITIGFAFKSPTVFYTTPYDFFWFKENTNNGVGLKVTSTGAIQVYVTADTGESVTSTNTLAFNTWYYLELQVKLHVSAGTFELRLDDVVWAENATAGRTFTSYSTNNMTHWSITAVRNGNWLFDDLYLLDSSGTKNNDFLGSQRVVAISPNAKVSGEFDWTPSDAGSEDNYQDVDDGNQHDADSTYVETSGDGDQDLYEYSDLGSEVGDVAGVQINTDVRVTTGSMDILNVAKSSSTEDTGSATTVTSIDYLNVNRILEQDPNGSIDWTRTSINAASFGIKSAT